jgi:hypothetical protein
MRGEVRGVQGEAIGAPFHDVCDDAAESRRAPSLLQLASTRLACTTCQLGRDAQPRVHSSS